MVIIITGATHTGKTLLAQRLIEKYKYPCLSIDHLKMGLIRSGMTSLTPEDDNALTEFLWPVVREMIKTAVENRQDFIVEGCYVLPDWMNDFGAEYLPFIRCVCLAMSDRFIDANFKAVAEHACDIEKRLDESYLTPEALKRDNRDFIEKFGKNEGQLALIDDDYEKTVNKLTDGI